jgi:hypothetical protein
MECSIDPSSTAFRTSSSTNRRWRIQWRPAPTTKFIGRSLRTLCRVLRGEDVTIAGNHAGGAGGIASCRTEPRSWRRYGTAIARHHPGSGVGTAYGTIFERVSALFSLASLPGNTLFVDQTAVGDPVRPVAETGSVHWRGQASCHHKWARIQPGRENLAGAEERSGWSPTGPARYS